MAFTVFIFLACVNTQESSFPLKEKEKEEIKSIQFYS